MTQTNSIFNMATFIMMVALNATFTSGAPIVVTIFPVTEVINNGIDINPPMMTFSKALHLYDLAIEAEGSFESTRLEIVSIHI